MSLNAQKFCQVLQFAHSIRTKQIEIADGVVQIGDTSTLSEQQREQLTNILLQFRPYRKGPFDIFGIRIDANWKSDIKLERLRKIMSDKLFDLSPSARVADLGCNNGYFMIALGLTSSYQITGFDPTLSFYQFFRFLKTLCPAIQSEFMRERHHALQYFRNSFDLMLCMGVLYHVKDPVYFLEILKKSLDQGGKLLLETIITPSKHPYGTSLVPDGTYAGMNGVWHVPDQKCVLNWLKRTGFAKAEFLHEHDYRNEQHQTAWGPLPALDDFIDQNTNQTIENYPIPQRAWFLAQG